MTASRAQNVGTLVLVICAVVVAAAIARREFLAQPMRNARAGVQEKREKNWRQYAAAGHVIGAENSSVTIVEFSDFQCPVCRRFALMHDSLAKLGLNVKVVYRHFPLHTHRQALNASIASECAAAQGRFEQVHDALFAHPESLGVAPWWNFARRAAVKDSAEFDACISTSRPQPALERDTVDGRRLKIRGTPTLLIHDLRVDGLPSLDSMVAFIKRAADLSGRRSRQ